MRDEDIEQLWYGFCLIKTLITLFVLSGVVLLCKRFLRRIPWNRASRRSTKCPIVHSLGTAPPIRKAAELDPGDTKRRIG
jgi:hypothetical protein